MKMLEVGKGFKSSELASMVASFVCISDDVIDPLACRLNYSIGWLSRTLRDSFETGGEVYSLADVVKLLKEINGDE